MDRLGEFMQELLRLRKRAAAERPAGSGKEEADDKAEAAGGKADAGETDEDSEAADGDEDSGDEGQRRRRQRRR
jgi:hypothetical protein